MTQNKQYKPQPMMDIVRFRINSHSSMDQYNFHIPQPNNYQNFKQTTSQNPSPINDQLNQSIKSYQYNNIKSSPRDQKNSGLTLSSIKKKNLQSIPLINKNMNHIEKYINQFKLSQALQKSRKKQKLPIHTPLYDQNLSNQKHFQKILSPSKSMADYYNYHPKDQALKELEEKCYVKYQSISAHNTQNKIQALELAQNQYVKLKHSITIPFKQNNDIKQQRKQSVNDNTYKIPIRGKQSITTHHYVNNKSIEILKKKRSKQRLQKNCSQNNSNNLQHKINLSDIQKQLKTSLVQQNGKKYFADLYLMKKQRDKIMNEIFKSSNEKEKINLGNQSHLYDKKGSQFNIPATNTNLSNIGVNLAVPSKNNQLDNLIKLNSSKVINPSIASTQKDITNINFKKFPKISQPKFSLPASLSLSYEQKMRKQQQNFVQQKILRQRSQKKQKMLKGRNMNWNVYYQMLALKKNQKDKLKKYCKFSQTYGED